MPFLTWLFLPLKNVTHYNHYLTEVVPPTTTTTRRMKLLQCLEETLWDKGTSAGSPVGSSTENVSCSRTATWWQCTASIFAQNNSSPLILFCTSAQCGIALVSKAEDQHLQRRCMQHNLQKRTGDTAGRMQWIWEVVWKHHAFIKSTSS